MPRPRPAPKGNKHAKKVKLTANRYVFSAGDLAQKIKLELGKGYRIMTRHGEIYFRDAEGNDIPQAELNAIAPLIDDLNANPPIPETQHGLIHQVSQMTPIERSQLKALLG